MFLENLESAGASAETIALAQGIILGDKSQISAEVLEQFRTAGMSHLLAVSGLHVGIIMSVIWILFKPFEVLVLLLTDHPELDFRVGSPVTAYILGSIRSICVIILTVIYVYSIGSPPSAVRATLMLSMCLVGWMLHRPASMSRSLLFAALVIMAYDPWIVTDVGFLLSFLSVSGILLFQPWLQDRSKPWVWRVILLSVSAQLLTIPVVAYTFHQVPFFGWLQGIFVVPLMPLFVSLLLVIICFPGFSWLCIPVEVIRAWMSFVAEQISNLEVMILGGHLYFYPSLSEAFLSEVFILSVILIFRISESNHSLRNLT